MNNFSGQNKKDFAKLLIATLDPISCDTTSAKAYLAEEGLDPQAIKEEGLKRIRKLQLQIKASQTRQQMVNSEPAKRQAMDWVERLLSDAKFSFHQFVRENQLVLQNRNLDSLTPDDIKNTLVDYFYLQFINQSPQQNNEQ